MRDDRPTGERRRPGQAQAAARAAGPEPAAASEYDRIATLYDPWSRSVVEDVAFYVDEARKAAGRAGVDPATPVVELGVGTGRIAVPVAAAGVSVIGVDSSQGMLDVCRRRAEAAGVSGRLDLRVGDFRRPPVAELVALVMCPFRAYLHLPDDDEERVAALRAARELLVPGGRLAFDVFAPSSDDIEETHGRWLEREPGIWERATWDEAARRLTLEVRGHDAETTLGLTWIPAHEWRVLLGRAGFEVEACYGWFDRRPYTGGEDSVWLAERRP
ncbi:MAG TPA: class I SAM-dependent methyltransferase [Gaiellaceae bacterium]|jgi:SAM-dependent methyltransferase